MASPVDAGRTNTNITTASDPWTVNMPGSVAAGDLLLMWIRIAAAGNVVAITGWSQLLAAESPDASDDTNEIWVKIADGTEGGGSASVDMSTTLKGAAIVWRITGYSGVAFFGSGSVEHSTATVSTVANINPASFTPSAPGGSKDYLWLSLIGMDSETGTATNGTLSNVVSANSGTGGVVATNCIIWGGSLASTASSIDIAAWTSSAPANGASAYTIAIYPPGVAGDVFGTGEVYYLQAVNRASIW